MLLEQYLDVFFQNDVHDTDVRNVPLMHVVVGLLGFTPFQCLTS